MRYTRKSILDLLCASLQRNIVDIDDLKDVAALYREQDMSLRSCSLNFVVEALRDDIFNVDELREAAKVSVAERKGYGGGPSRYSRDKRGSDLQPGDWLCEQCGHHNFARRKECQREFCKAPRPGARTLPSRPGDWDCEKCGEMNFAYRTECHRTDCKAPRPEKRVERPESSARGVGGGGYGKAMDDGDWNCDKCGTLNFARRAECFNTACKAPRNERRVAPYVNNNLRPGDWVCKECDMVNFARRTVCHRSSCMKPRPEQD